MITSKAKYFPQDHVFAIEEDLLSFDRTAYAVRVKAGEVPVVVTPREGVAPSDHAPKLDALLRAHGFFLEQVETCIEKGVPITQVKKSQSTDPVVDTSTKRWSITFEADGETTACFDSVYPRARFFINADGSISQGSPKCTFCTEGEARSKKERQEGWYATRAANKDEGHASPELRLCEVYESLRIVVAREPSTVSVDVVI